MLRKKLSSGEFSIIEDTSLFPKGTCFVRDGKTGRVKEVISTDSMQRRRLIYSDGTDEIVTLSTLVEDSKQETFKIIEDEEQDN